MPCAAWPATDRCGQAWLQTWQSGAGTASSVHNAHGKVTRQEHTMVQAIPVPRQKFTHVHMDLVGPLSSSSRGHTHLLTIVDRTTRWPEVVPLQSIYCKVIHGHFCRHSWVAHYGVPQQVTTDRGAQFTSSEWGRCASSWEFSTSQQLLTTPKAMGWWRDSTGSLRRA